MSVLINYKICDNAPECDWIKACPFWAFIWDSKTKSITIDNSKCTSCWICEKACPIWAIKVAKNKEEYEKIKKEFKNDPRKISDLFVDKYGSEPMKTSFLIDEDKIDFYVTETWKPLILELFNENSIECLINSIPIKDLLQDMDVVFRKVEITNDLSVAKFDIKSYPSLLIFNQWKFLWKIEGYYDINRKDELKDKIKNILFNYIEQVEQFARIEYEKHDDFHKWNHAEDVMGMAMYLAKFYKEANIEILKIAAMLHDVTYPDYETHVDKSVETAKKFLKEIWYPEDRIKRVVEAMLDHSWVYRKINWEARTIEGKIIYDSDKFHYAPKDPEWFEIYLNHLYLSETRDLIKEKSKTLI